MELIDSHAHIDGPEFDEDRDEVIARARAAGVSEIVIVGAAGDMETAERTVRIAEQHAGIHATVGVHPHDASKLQDGWWPRLRELASRDSVCAVGETGLDYHYDHSRPPWARSTWHAECSTRAPSSAARATEA